MKTKAIGLTILAVLSLIFTETFAQTGNVGIGTSNPDASSMLDVSSTVKGMLVPRMNTTQRNSIVSPATGLLIYNTDNQSINTFNGTVWVSAASSGWSLIGNSGTNPAMNFLGTTDNQPLKFKVNNLPAGEINPANNNILFGIQAGANTTGHSNVAIGVKALFNNTDKNHLVAIGDSVLYNNGVGATYPEQATGNTAIGSKALYSNTTGSFNTAIGKSALRSNTTPQGNTAIGADALYSNTTGSGNTASGYLVLYFNTTGINNTASGVLALYSNTDGDGNTASGDQALRVNTTGSNNSAYGMNALQSNTTGHSNIAMGMDALYSNTVRGNLVAIGDSALYKNGLNSTIADHATGNTAIGSKALYNNTTGYRNTASGYQALQANNTGDWNTANGYQTLYTNTTGSSNQAYGPHALYYNTTGSYNIAVGRAALFKNEDGQYNTSVGHKALYENISYDNNTAVGYSAGDNYTCTNGTFLGANAYPNANGYTNCMALGYSARATASNRVVIGNENVTSIGGYEPWTNFSDGRFKKNIRENVPGLEFIKQLRPITYTLDMTSLKADLNKNRPNNLPEEELPVVESPEDIASRKAKEKIVYTGFVAQEVEEAAKSIGYDFSGVDVPKNEKGQYGLRYAEFVVPLVMAVQEQQEIIERQQRQNEIQQNQIENQQKQIDELILTVRELKGE